jgi:hypothetical protein
MVVMLSLSEFPKEACYDDWSTPKITICKLGFVNLVLRLSPLSRMFLSIFCIPFSTEAPHGTHPQPPLNTMQLLPKPLCIFSPRVDVGLKQLSLTKVM